MLNVHFHVWWIFYLAMLLVYVVLQVGEFSAARDVRWKLLRLIMLLVLNSRQARFDKNFQRVFDGTGWKGFGKVLRGFNDHAVEIF